MGFADNYGLDVCADLYKKLELDEQIEFKSAAKSFVRTYGFLGAILPYGDAEWEKLSIFLNLLIPKLPSPEEDDLSAGVIEAIDLESYRAEAQNMMSIHLEDSDAEVDPVPTGKPRNPTPPELDLVSHYFHDLHISMLYGILKCDEDRILCHRRRPGANHVGQAPRTESGSTGEV